MPSKRHYNLPTESRMYADLLRRAEPISREEEYRLFVALQAGDESAREKIVMANLRFAFSKAIEMAPPSYNVDDLVAAANMGLLRAIELYDMNSGIKFISYAVHWIKAKIQEELQTDRLIHIPVNQQEDVREYRRTQTALYNQGQAPTHDEIVEAIGGEGLSHIKDALVQMSGVASVEAFKMGGDNGRASEQNYYECYADPEAPQTDEGVETAETNRAIDEAMSRLPRDLFAMVRMYYGLQGSKPHTLKEIGDLFGVTRERIRQLKNHAEEKIQQQNPALAVHLYD